MLRSKFIGTSFGRKFSTLDGPLPKYDVIIVGGGHNGLVAAAYLAKNNIKTCVLERRPIIGGAAVSEEIIKDFKFSRASYLLSLLRPQIYTDLNLRKYGLKYYVRNPSSYTPLRKPFWSSNAKSLTLGRNAEENRAEISKFSASDAENYFLYENKLEKFVDCIQPLMDLSPATITQLCSKKTSISTKLKTILKSSDLRNAIYGMRNLIPLLPFAYEIMLTPATEVMNKWFENEILKATLITDTCIGSFQSPASIGSSYVLIHHVMGGIEEHKGAWVYPEGGMGTVSNAIAKCAADHGAHIFTNKLVTEITLNDRNEVTGVVTDEKHHIRCSMVLSNATSNVTFLDLLPREALNDKFKKKIQNIDYRSPVTKLNVALSRIPNFEADPNSSRNSLMPHHQCTVHLNCENVDFILDAYNKGKQGFLPKRPFIEMCLPSSLDKTLCPPDHHVCLLFTQYTNYTLHGGRTWDEHTKTEYANIVFDSVEEYAPGFKDSIIGYEILTPPDLERIFGLTGGHIFHGELSLNQLLFNRPANWSTLSPYTPIKGLLLCGSGAHPGGGITGSPGRLAALSVIEEMKK